MRRTLTSLWAAALLVLALAACTDPITLPAASVESASLGAGGQLTIAGGGFFQYPGGQGMRVEVCGATMDATLVDPTTVELLLPPAGVVTVQTGESLTVTLPEGLQPGDGALRIFRPDGQVVELEGAIECPTADPEPETEPDPDPEPEPEPVPAVAVLNADRIKGPAPLSVWFDTDGSSGEGFLTTNWDFGDGTTDGPDYIVGIRHEYTEPGEYTVTLTVTAENGESDTTTLLITVTEPVKADLTATPTEGEAPLTVLFDSTGSTGDGDLTRSWLFPFGGNTDAAKTNYTFNDPGEYTVYVTITDEHGSADTAGVTITVTEPNPAPTARITYEIDHPDEPFYLAWIEYSGATSSDPDGDELTYAWYNLDDYPEYPFPFNGLVRGGGNRPYGETWRLRLEVTDEQGASDTHDLNIYFDPPESIWNPPEPKPDHLVDVTDVSWSARGGTVTMTLTTVERHSLIEPGAMPLCPLSASGYTPSALADDTMLGFIGIDIDRNPDTGVALEEGLPGFEYAIILDYRNHDGDYPLVRAEGYYGDCETFNTNLVQWVTPTLNDNTLTLTFDEIEGRGNDFDISGFIETRYGSPDTFPDASLAG